jgi:hypothetical protein
MSFALALVLTITLSSLMVSAIMIAVQLQRIARALQTARREQRLFPASLVQDKDRSVWLSSPRRPPDA